MASVNGSSNASTTNGPIFTCAGKSYPCTSDSPFDADVCGLGVMISFIATTVITFCAIVYGYIRGILPGVQLNEADGLFLNMVRRTVLLERDAEKQQQLEDRTEKFILTLSDQQLVTGLAVLIAGLAKCDNSTYSENTVAALAWLSSTTHLATIVILCRYLRSQAAVRTTRVVAMIALALLLSASQVMTFITTNLAVPIDLCFYCALQNLSQAPGSFDGADIFTIYGLIFPLLYMIGAYFARLSALYEKPDSITPGTMRSILAGMEDKPFTMKERTLREVIDGKGTIMKLIPLGFSQLNQSFFSTLAGMLYMGSYGLTQVVMVWQSGNPSFEMGFGQMVPLFLLILPVFAVIETVSEYKTNVVHTEDHTLLICESPLPNLVVPTAEIPTSEIPTAEIPTSEIPSAKIPTENVPTFIPQLASGNQSRTSTLEITRAEEGIPLRRLLAANESSSQTRGTNSTVTISVNSISNHQSTSAPLKLMLERRRNKPATSNVSRIELTPEHIDKIYAQPRFRGLMAHLAFWTIVGAIAGGILCAGVLPGNSNIIFNMLLIVLSVLNLGLNTLTIANRLSLMLKLWGFI